MATLIPPPSKRLKAAAKAEAEAPRPPVPTVIVQFQNATEKTLLGPPVSLPADTERAGLELLVNKLRGEVSRLCVFSKQAQLKGVVKGRRSAAFFLQSLDKKWRRRDKDPCPPVYICFVAAAQGGRRDRGCFDTRMRTRGCL
jgi:hypothetical protein